MVRSTELFATAMDPLNSIFIGRKKILPLTAVHIGTLVGDLRADLSTAKIKNKTSIAGRVAEILGKPEPEVVAPARGLLVEMIIGGRDSYYAFNTLKRLGITKLDKKLLEQARSRVPKGESTYYLDEALSLPMCASSM